MSNVIPFKAPDQKQLATIATGFSQMAKNPQTFGDGKPILKMDKHSGDWFFGPENIEVEAGAEWAVNIATWQHGWRAWSEFGVGTPEILGEILVGLNDPLPAASTLPDVGQPYKKAFSVELTCISGEDEGITVVYSPTSQGGEDFFGKLGVQIGKQVDAGSKAIVPIIVLEHSTYISKKYGPQTKPEFLINGWTEFGKKAVQKAKPKASRARKAEPQKRTRRK